MSKFSQLLKMIKILEGAEKPIKRKDVAEMLEVSPRMVRKYIDDLKESGYDVISTSGRNGGLQIERAKDPEQMNEEFLTLDETIYLKTLLKLNRQEVEEKLQYIEQIEKSRPKELELTKKYLVKQLNNNKSIERKLFY